MDTIILWGGLALLVALLTFLNQKQMYSSRVKQTYRELRELVEQVRNDQSSAHDLSRWESALPELEKHPNEFNKLDYEIGLRRAFVKYLEKHYPHDARLPGLQEAAAHQKDTVWGIKMGDFGSKK